MSLCVAFVGFQQVNSVYLMGSFSVYFTEEQFVSEAVNCSDVFGIDEPIEMFLSFLPASSKNFQDNMNSENENVEGGRDDWIQGGGR